MIKLNRVLRIQIRFIFLKTLSSLFLVSILLLPPSGVFALGSCTATSSTPVANAGNSNSITFVITNNDTLTSANWIHIQRPSEFFWIGGASTEDWTVGGDSNELFLDGNSIAPGQSASIELSFTADVVNIAPQNWIIEASDTGDSGGASGCAGSHSTSISGHPDNSSNNGVSDVLGTSSNSSATITWNSDYPTSSYVYYGTTSGYGNVSNYDSAQTQEHSVTLTGLSSNTGYHFQVAGTDSSGSSVWSADSTFISDTQSSGGNAGGLGGSPQIVDEGTDSTPNSSSNPSGPAITIDTEFASSYKSAPLISGRVNGVTSISRIEYSIDDAKNWLQADDVDGLGTLTAKYSFTPVNLKDGNYSVVVRATDESGNSNTVSSKTFVIDLLPPIVGTTSAQIGTQTISPNPQGMYGLVEGTDTLITVSAIGGPTTIYLEAKKFGEEKSSYTFTLKQSIDTRLWTGIASFTLPGIYTLQANAVDGAQNKTSRPMGMVNVQAMGSTTDIGTNDPVASTISVYFLDPETNTMMLWDSEYTNQKNPFKTYDDGKYSFYLPTGTYYLKITAPGYKTVTTNIFKLDQLTNVTNSIKLQKRPSLRFLGISITFPWVSFKQTKIDLTLESSEVNISNSPDKLPSFSLDLSNGKKLSTADLYAKPTIVSFVSTWSDAGRDQLSLLSSVQSDEINIVPVASGESLSRLRVYMALGGYTTPVLADVNNTLVQDLGVSNTPTHYFMNRRGKITKTVSGVMSYEELMNNVTN